MIDFFPNVWYTISTKGKGYYNNGSENNGKTKGSS